MKKIKPQSLSVAVKNDRAPQSAFLCIYPDIQLSLPFIQHSKFDQKNSLYFSGHPDTLREAYIIGLFGATFLFMHPCIHAVMHFLLVS
jgi:hypothetical protein